MNTNWPKNKNVGDIYVNPKGIKWKWNGKGWVSLKESEVVYLVHLVPVVHPEATGWVQDLVNTTTVVAGDTLTFQIINADTGGGAKDIIVESIICELV